MCCCMNYADEMELSVDDRGDFSCMFMYATITDISPLYISSKKLIYYVR